MDPFTLALLLFGGGVIGKELFDSTTAPPVPLTSRRKIKTGPGGLQSAKAGNNNKPGKPGSKWNPWPKGKRPKLKQGPLPAAAIAAWNAPKHGKRKKRSAYGPANDIHVRGSWIRFATYSDNWDKKLEKMRIYANPPGTLYVKSTSKVRNLTWMMMAPPKLYPGYGRAKRRNVRWSAMKTWLSPKADWNTLKGGVKASIKGIPAVVKGAGVVVGAIVTLGKSLLKDTAGQTETIEEALKAAIKPIGDTGSSIKKRKAAARAVYTVISNKYVQDVMEANPHAVKDGKLDIGKHYMSNPKTYADLRTSGKARPLLFIPE